MGEAERSHNLSTNFGIPNIWQTLFKQFSSQYTPNRWTAVTWDFFPIEKEHHLNHRENGGTLGMVPWLFNPPQEALNKSDIPIKYPLYKV